MANFVLIKNANIVLENGILWDGAILIKDGIIADIGLEKEMAFPSDAEIVDAGGLYVGPGFVDIHVHGGGRSQTYEEPIKASEYFLDHGETTILATPSYSMSLDEFLGATRNVKKAWGEAKTIRGIYMEGPYTNPEYGSRSWLNPWRNGVLEKDYKFLIDEAGKYVKVWSIAPEREDIMPFLEYARVVNPEVVFAVGHSEATPAEIRALGSKYRPTLMTHTFNATGRQAVAGGTRGFGPDEYCMKDPEMYAELISDSCGIHVHSEMQQLLVHCKGVDKIVLITDSTVSIGENPDQYKHIKDLNFDESGGLSGSKMTMEQACRNIMTHTSCGIAQAFKMASLNPAKVIGMDNELGSIVCGKRADVIFVDDKFNVKKVMLGGEMCRG